MKNSLKTSAVLGMGSLILPACSDGSKSTDATATDSTTAPATAASNAMPASLAAIGLQLYTVREQMDQDTKGTLQKVADIGYKNMEIAAGSKGHYYGMKPAELASMMKDLGLTLRSGHVLAGGQTQQEAPLPASMLTLTNGTQQLVDMAAEAGQEYLVCAYMFPSEYNTLDGLKRTMETLSKAGEACQKAGVQFCYHNHDFEFSQQYDGKTMYEMMLEQLDPEQVKYELDLYWVSKSNQDPVAWFEKYPGRFPLWHVKDMDNTEKKFFTEVGNGTIDFKRIFENADKSGMKYYFVEQDQTPGNPLESIATSYQNLTQLLA
ncbi:sugar phosphate isomerase/epimerase family protein [Catalinimonas alkaloidigena]|uniref:sugar phosphate isomerase/epimerase family protein n=1 Tax=Catalinimonas alkaloidigena TaxID=1075417 RepID=UPI001FDF2DF6|nr:sugar phosphate isomerase/epimerase [Catalinimonas alkaloidigena]